MEVNSDVTHEESAVNLDESIVDVMVQVPGLDRESIVKVTKHSNDDHNNNNETFARPCLLWNFDYSLFKNDDLIISVLYIIYYTM